MRNRLPYIERTISSAILHVKFFYKFDRETNSSNNNKMDFTLWLLVTVKIFVIFWLIYYIFERRKTKKESDDSLSSTEQGIITTYAVAPVARIPNDFNEYNQQQFYEVDANMMPAKYDIQPGVHRHHHYMIKTKS